MKWRNERREKNADLFLRCFSSQTWHESSFSSDAAGEFKGSAAQHVAHWHTYSHACSLAFSLTVWHTNTRRTLRPQFPAGNRKYTNILSEQKKKNSAVHRFRPHNSFPSASLCRPVVAGGICFLSPSHSELVSRLVMGMTPLLKNVVKSLRTHASCHPNCSLSYCLVSFCMRKPLGFGFYLASTYVFIVCRGFHISFLGGC